MARSAPPVSNSSPGTLGRSELAREGNVQQQPGPIREQARSYQRFSSVGAFNYPPSSGIYGEICIKFAIINNFQEIVFEER